MKKNSGKKYNNSKDSTAPWKADAVVMAESKSRPMRTEAERLKAAGKLAEAKSALKSIRRIQQFQPLEVRLEACSLVLTASIGNLSSCAVSIVKESAANPLAQSILSDIAALQTELESGLTVLESASSTPQPETKTLTADIDNLRSLPNKTAYRNQLNRIKNCLHKDSVKNHILKLRLVETLNAMLIDLVIPDYLRAHPEDGLTAFCFSIYQALCGLSGADAYAPVSFLRIDDAGVRLLLPSCLNEKSIPEDFLFCARTIYEVSEYLPYSAVQDLIEQLTAALRNRLDTILLDPTDGGGAAFGLWDKHREKILDEAIKEAGDSAAPENPDGFLSEVQSVLELLDKRGAEEGPGSLSPTAYALLHTMLRDKVIFSMAYAVEKESELPEFVKGILPLYIAMLSSASRGRNDFWNDPVFLLWETTL